MVKKLILVTSPPACGKTYISKALAARLEHVVYLDKDTLITLSKQIFKVANQPYNRSSQFFEDNIRDYEYDCVVDLALEALDYEDKVLINAPFTREIRDMDYIQTPHKYKCRPCRAHPYKSEEEKNTDRPPPWNPSYEARKKSYPSTGTENFSHPAEFPLPVKNC